MSGLDAAGWMLAIVLATAFAVFIAALPFALLMLIRIRRAQAEMELRGREMQERVDQGARRSGGGFKL